MADRYWVGGTGTWDSTSTTNWSDTSGGAGGFSVPTAADNVIFDAGSDGGSWNIAGAAFLQTFSVAAQETGPRGVFFKPDGTKMYIIGASGDDINEYDLSSAWDVSSASFLQIFSVAAQDTGPRDVFFKPDGTKMYVLGNDGNAVYEYDLSSAWNVSSATFLQTFSVAAQDTGIQGIFFKPDGTKMYVVGAVGGAVYEYDLSSAWDISSAVFLQSFSVAAQETQPTGVFFRPDGIKMYVVGSDTDAVYEYDLSSAWNVSSATFLQTFSVAAQEISPQGVFFKPDGTKMYVTGNTGDNVNEYDLAGGSAFVVTMANSPRVCNDFTASGLNFGMTLAGTSIGLTVSGSLSFPATNFTRTYTGTTTFNATTTGKTVTTNGVAFGGTPGTGAVTFDGVGGAWTLGSALTATATTITLTNGTFDTSASNYAVTAGAFSSSNTNVRTINLNGSTITLTFISSTWVLTTSTNATLNAGTSNIVLTSSSAEFQGGGKTYYDVNFSSTSMPVSPFQLRTVRGVNTFNNLTCATTATDVNPFIIDNNQTINGTLTLSGADGNQRLFVRSVTNAGPTGVQTLTCAAVALTDVDFRDITIAGAAAPASGTRLGDCTGNSGITFDAGVNKYWNLATGGNWNANAWATSSGGAVANTNFPLAQDTVIIENTGLNTSATVTVNVAYNIGNLDMSTRSNAMTLAISGAPIIYGNVAYSSAVTPAGTGTITFSNRSIKTFDSAGKTLDNAIIILAPGGGVQLVNNNFVSGSTRVTQISLGTLDLNDFDWTTGLFDLGFFGTRAIDFGTGEINLSGTGTVWNIPFAPGPTISGTPVVNVTSTGATSITVAPGSVSEADSVSFNFTGGTYNLSFLATGGHVARDVNFTGYAGTWQSTQASVAIYGSLTLSSGMSLTATTNSLRFSATSGTKTITSNGKTIDFPVTFNGAGGTWQLQDAMTLGSTRLAIFQNGTVDLNGFTLTSGTAQTLAGTKNVTFNGGTLLLSGSGNAWNNIKAGSFTTTAGTGTGAISMTSASAKTFVGGGSTYNCNLNQGGAGTLTITGSNTFNDITNTVQPATILFLATTTQTVSNFTLSGTSGNLIIIDSTSASQFTLSKASGTVSADFLSISRSTATGGAEWYAGDNSTDGSNNSGWIFTAPPVSTATGNFLMFF